MRWVFYFLAGLLISAGLGWLIANDSGYVLLHHGSWTVELSFTLFAALMLVLLGCVVGVTLVIGRLSVRRWRRRVVRNERGWLYLLQGNYSRARRTFAGNYSRTKPFLLSTLGEVYASHGAADRVRRDRALLALVKNSRLSAVAIGLVQARLMLDDNEPEQALAVINSLLKNHKKVTALYKLKYRCFIQLNNWIAIAEQLSEFKKRGVFTAQEFPAVQLRCAEIQLEAGIHQGANALNKIYSALPSSLRAQPKIIQRYIRGLIAVNNMIEAEKRLAKILSANWDSELLALYDDIRLASYDRMYERCETWLKEHPNDALLQLIAGKLAYRCQLWGRSRNHLEACLVAGPPRLDALVLLGLLMEKLDEPHNATAYYQQAAQFLLNQKAPLLLSVLPDKEDKARGLKACSDL